MATAPLYQSLTAQSTPDQIAQAYAQAVSSAGGDTQENQKVAIDYLTNLGIGQDVIGQAYNQYLQPADAPNTYFQQNPDVAAAYANRANDPNLASTVNMTPDQFAAMHYQKHGSTAAEQRAAPTTGALAQATTPAPAAPDYAQMVRDAYASIGRAGIGTAASNIDQAGFDGWVNALQTGQTTPEAFQRNFQTAVADYLVRNPEDQYSTYVTNFLQQNNAPEISGVQQLYRDVLGRDADPSGLGTWYQKFGSEISPEERAEFELAAAPELRSRVEGLYTDMLGRDADAEGIEYWTNQFGSDITDDEREQFRQSAAAELTGTFGGESPDDAKLLEGFKRVNDLGIDEAALRKTLGDETYDAYKNQLTNFATTNIEGILADNELTFDESQRVYNFARDLGYSTQELADLTGQEKSLFDLIDTNYKTSRDQIIKGSLEAPTVESDADRVLTALALQDQFGFSDEDLSEATGYNLEDLRSALNPVRNFQTDFSEIVGSTETTTEQLRDFITQSTGNAAIDKMYGDSLGQVETKLQELEQKWAPFGTDAFQAENLYNQLARQKEALGGQYYSGVFGDLEKSAAALVNKGLDTLNDLGQKDKFQPTKAEVRYTTANGEPVLKLDDGSFVVSRATGGEYTEYVEIPKDQVNAAYGRSEYVNEGGGDSGYTKFVPLTAEERATLGEDDTYQKKLGTVVIDKDTGQELTGLDGNLLYQRSGGTFTGKKHYLTAQFTPEGAPILTASQEKSGIYKFVSDVGPMIVSMAAMIPGPHQPFAMAANAALALEQKNYIGAVLSAVGAYGTYTGQQLASLTAAQKAGTVTDAAATAAQIKDLTGTMANIKLAQTAISGVNALATKNLPGLINASLSAYGQTGGKLPSGLTTAVQAGNLAIAIDKGDVAGAMFALGDLTESKDFKIAGAAKNFVDAFQTGDPAKIASAGMAFTKIVGSSDGKQAPVEDMKPTSYGTNITKQLTDAGLEEADLPTGIQTASLDGEIPFRAEMGASPIFAEDPRAEGIRPPAGYRVLSRSEQDERLVSQGSGDLPSKYETVRPVGSYYDRTLNAWLAPSGEFEAATSVEDFSKYFGSPNLSDADVEDIYRGVQAGDVTADDLFWLTGESGKPLSSEEIQSIVSGIPKSGKPPADYVGEIVTTAKRPVIEPAYEEPGEPEYPEMVVTAKRPVVEPAYEEQAEPQEVPEVETEYPEMVVTAPREPAPPAEPSAPAPTATPAVSATPTAPAQVAQVKKQLAKTLNLPVSSPIVQDVIEALYGTMEYLDIGEEFEPSKRKAKPAATQKQLQQTKMAQGGYLDDLLAENMSVDDLLKLLR